MPSYNPTRKPKLHLPGAKAQNRVGLSRKHVVEGLQASLKRMQLEYVDLVFCHRPDPITPMEEVVRSFNHVIERGMAFYWGTSEWSAAQLQADITPTLTLTPTLTDLHFELLV